MDFATNPDDGVRIACRSTGTGPAVVLVHGTALSQVIWRGFGYLADLSADHRVITLDLRGHGRSDKPHDDDAYAMERLVADVRAVLDHFDVSRADYVGYSLGGRVGFSLADGYPSRVRRFVSVAGAPGNTAGAFDRVFFPGCVASIEAGGMAGFVEDWEEHSGGPLDAATRHAFTANDPQALAAYMRRSERDPGVPAERLAAMTTPTLMLVGRGDTERLRAAEAVLAARPATQVEILDGATHGDVLRHPRARPAVRAFLDAGQEATRPDPG